MGDRGRGARGGGMYRSPASGRVFTRLSGDGSSGILAGDGLDLQGDPSKLTRLFATVAGSGVYRSLDSGASWTRVGVATVDAKVGATTSVEKSSTWANGDTVNMKLAINAAGSSIFAAIVNATAQFKSSLAFVYRSVDHGDAWTAVDLPGTCKGSGTPPTTNPTTCTGAGQSFVGIHPGNQGVPNTSIAVDSSNANIVYLGGDTQPNVLIAAATDIGAATPDGRLFRCDASLAAATPCRRVRNTPTTGGSAPHPHSPTMVFVHPGDPLPADDGGNFQHPTPPPN